MLGAVAGATYYITVHTADIYQLSYALSWRRAHLVRVLWRHTSGAASVWQVDGDGTIIHSAIYGPFAGWEPYRLVVGFGGSSLLLWKHVNGSISIWQLAPDGSLLAHRVFGPFHGWSITDLSVATWDYILSLIWTRTDGALSRWRRVTEGSRLDDWQELYSHVYGPYPGWTPAADAVDSEGSGHVLWTTAAGVAGLWSINWGDFNDVGASVQGPYAGWTPHALTAGSPDVSSRLLWRHTSGAAGLWHRDASGNLTTTSAFGPFAGWEPVTLAVPTIRPEYGDNDTRVLWRHTNGSAAVWSVTAAGQLLKSFAYGPFAGWTAIDVAAGPE